MSGAVGCRELACASPGKTTNFPDDIHSPAVHRPLRIGREGSDNLELRDISASRDRKAIDDGI